MSERFTASLILLIWELTVAGGIDAIGRLYSPRCIYPACRGDDCLVTCDKDHAP